MHELPDDSHGIFEGQPIRTRRNGSEIIVAHDASAVLRRGPAALIADELTGHRSLIARGYPVAKILASGDGWFIEQHLGEASMALQFARAVPGSPERARLFDAFLGILQQYSAAQATDAHVPIDTAALFATLCLDENLYLYDDATLRDHHAAIARLAADLDGVPAIWSHGDFNAWNIHDDGVIDFEDAFLAPLAYDLVTAIVTPDAFATQEERPGAEFSALYRFTVQERVAMLELARGLAGADAERTIPACAMTRWFWHLRRMDHAPVIQQFRLEHVQSLMRDYVHGRLTTEAIVAGT